MKKLMVAAVAVAVAAVAQAANYSWGYGYGVNAYNDPGQEGALASGTIYLIDAGSLSQADFISGVLGAGKDYASTFATLVASAKVNEAYLNGGAGTIDVTANTSGTYDGDNNAILATDAPAENVTYYQVMLDTANNGVFISETVDALPPTTGAADMSFLNDGAYSRSAYAKTQKTFDADGWYTADVGGGGDVPEPTSAMLMLLGVAGLALRRKQK